MALTKRDLETLDSNYLSLVVVPCLFKDGHMGRLTAVAPDVDGCCRFEVPGLHDDRWVYSSDLEMASGPALMECGAGLPRLGGGFKQDVLAIKWAELAPEWVFY